MLGNYLDDEQSHFVLSPRKVVKAAKLALTRESKN